MVLHWYQPLDDPPDPSGALPVSVSPVSIRRVKKCAHWSNPSAQDVEAQREIRWVHTQVAGSNQGAHLTAWQPGGFLTTSNVLVDIPSQRWHGIRMWIKGVWYSAGTYEIVVWKIRRKALQPFIWKFGLINISCYVSQQKKCEERQARDVTTNNRALIYWHCFPKITRALPLPS